MFLQTHGPHSQNGKRTPTNATLNGYMAKNSRNRMTRGTKDCTKHLALNRKVEDIQTKDATPLSKERTPWILTLCIGQNYPTSRKWNLWPLEHTSTASKWDTKPRIAARNRQTAPEAVEKPPITQHTTKPRTDPPQT